MILNFNQIKNKISKISLAKQLIFAITLLMFFLLTAVIWFSYQRTINVINRQQAASNLETLSLKRNDYENYFSQLKDYSMLLRYNTRMFSIFNSDKPLDYSDTSYVDSMLKDTFYSRNDVVSYKLYLLNNKTCHSITNTNFNVRVTGFDSSMNLTYLKKACSSQNYIYYRPEQSNGKLMTIYRVFINIINRHPLAYVEITVDSSYLRKLSSNGNGISDVLGVLDQNRQLYYTGDGSVLNRADLPAVTSAIPAANKSGSYSVEVNRKKYLAVFSDSEDSEWQFLSLIPKDVLQEATVETRNLSLALALVAFLVSAFLIFGMIQMQLKPLKLLAKQMQRVGKGDFSIKAHSGGNAEVNDLSHQFNLMTTHIDELIQKNYIAELNEKTARMKALESQINPHFLYNTLQAISTEAVLTGQNTIRQMVEALASMLRYSVQDKRMVPVSTEMKHVQEYLYLQTARFEDRLVNRIGINPDSESIMIPKMSIQILVENSIKHGLESTSEQICISIDIQIKNQFLCISVIDNGRGMTPQRLAEVRSMTEPDNADGSGIGLTNLASRLKILYDGQAALSIESELNIGTTVKLTIPISEGGDGDVSVADHR